MGRKEEWIELADCIIGHGVTLKEMAKNPDNYFNTPEEHLECLLYVIRHYQKELKEEQEGYVGDGSMENPYKEEIPDGDEIMRKVFWRR